MYFRAVLFFSRRIIECYWLGATTLEKVRFHDESVAPGETLELVLFLANKCVDHFYSLFLQQWFSDCDECAQRS